MLEPINLTQQEKRCFFGDITHAPNSIGAAVAAAVQQGREVAVLGFGISNRPLTAVLCALGARVCVYDTKTPAVLGEDAAAAERMGVRFVQEDEAWLNASPAVIFRSPGIRPDRPAIVQAVANGARLAGEMEWLLEQTPATVIGITGSDGKSTTTTVTALMLREEGKGAVYLGGNLGTPLLSKLPCMTADDFVVVELSSFQLSTPCRSPQRAAITNVTPNHLDWHTGMEEYTRAKTNIYRHSACARFVTNADNDTTAALAAQKSAEGGARVVLFSSQKQSHASASLGLPEAETILCKQGCITYHSADGTETPVLAAEDILLPGRHNLENYMTAIALVWGLVSKDTIARVARTFGGVPHRLELVRIRNGVKYYNSSIDSSPTRTAAALSALPPRSAVIICGGYDKHIPFAPLAQALCDRAAAVVLTGATADAIHAALLACPDFSPERLPVTTERDFASAVHRAASIATPGQNVLLSPACASFDAFVNFEARGERFRSLVTELP